MVYINQEAPKFVTDAFHEEQIKKINLEEYKGKWVVLFFYPADFTFVCPTELKELTDNYEKFKEMNVEVMSISRDTAFVHKAWHDNSPTIKQIKFPMLADPNGKISNEYGANIEEEGVSVRATFIIDPEGVIKAFEFHDNSIGRNVNELIRKIEAAQFVAKNNGLVCPASWNKGKNTLNPGMDLVGKL